MYYTIYKITNKLNSKIYIGMHKTKDLDDGYMGSGKLIRRAIVKNGIENFEKEILHVFDNEEEMRSKEAELVFIGEGSYNLCNGGKGGFGYINNTISTDQRKINRSKQTISDSTKKKISDTNKLKGIKPPIQLNPVYGHLNSEKTILKRKETFSKSNHQKGSKNSQFGTCWITNGTENKKIKKDDLDNWIALGYHKGRLK